MNPIIRNLGLLLQILIISTCNHFVKYAHGFLLHPSRTTTSQRRSFHSFHWSIKDEKEKRRRRQILNSFKSVSEEGTNSNVIISSDPEISTSTSTVATTTTTQKHICGHCGKKFETRNSLFRHLRNDPSCSNVNGQSNGISMTTRRDTTAILFSYDSFLPNENEEDWFLSSTNSNNPTPIAHPSDAQVVGNTICDAFHHALQLRFGKNNDIDSHTTTATTTNDDDDVEERLAPAIISSTQTSIAKLRGYESLSLENGISATGDTMTISYKYPIPSTLLDEKKNYQERKRVELFHSLRQDAIDFLSSSSSSSRGNSSSSSHITNIRILSAKILPSDTMFHAERSCTQRVYHYLLPIQWISGGNEIKKWWLESQTEDSNTYDKDEIKSNKTRSNTKSGIKGETRSKSQSPNQLRLFKSILRSFESQSINENYVDDDKNNVYDELNVNKKRFGRLATKELRAWHNFADPRFRGAAVSPNNKPVWRALDRCRIVKLLTFTDRNNISRSNEKDDVVDDIDDDDDRQIIAVIEFRGDDFIQQQVRRIIGTSVAMTNGWLPLNFTEISTHPEVFIETPLAPSNHMYQTMPRFHFDELSNYGRNIFSNEVDEDFQVQLTNEIHDRVIKQVICNQTDSEKKWLQNLREIVAPRIYDKLKSHGNNKMSVEQFKTYTVPTQYKETLTLLQHISSSGTWPKTSIARSKVIKDIGHDLNEERSDRRENGSFTILNPKYLNGILMKDQTEVKVPLGNKLFPELVDSIFELEKHLSTEIKGGNIEKRPSSSHCAVNCNAMFTPHVDSGRGCGQSLSMIVGLGSYSGGNLFIEDESFDICYQPKEFDGWRCRHWTEPFEGERFSLVWFTPEMKGINDMK